MNRALRQAQRKRCSYRKRGGGYGMGAPLVDFDPKVDTSFAVKMPINQGFSDCAFPARTGQLFNEPNPALAQTVMAGGRHRGGAKAHSGGAKAHSGGAKAHSGGACGCSVMRGGACGCSVMRGGAKAHSGGRRTRRTQRGAGYAVAVDPSVSVGGTGPNVGPLHSSVPCDLRAGSPNPYNATGLGADPRAPADLYSLTPNQTGGAYSTGNEWAPACYKAPGSELPTYEAQTAGFNFRPSIATGGVLPDGVTPYMDVTPYAARLGGGRKDRKSRRSSRKNRSNRSRKNRKDRKSAKKTYRRRH